jgi:MarR-like DNA-binding transcriptional regulator SgrR of sgrS sRNA
VTAPSRRTLALGAAVALLGAPAARAALGPRYGGDLTVAALALPPGHEPRVPRGSGESLIALLVHERLLRLDASGEPRGGLARDWLGAADGREWVLRLPPDAVFHDATPVTGTDATRSLRRFLRSGSAAAERLAETLDGGPAFRAERTDELPGLLASPSEVVLRFPEPVTAPLAPLAAPSAAIVSATGAAAGPFTPAGNVPGRRLALTAFGAHVRGRPLLDRVSLVAVPRADELETELQTRRASLVVGAGAWGTPAATLLLVLDPSRAPFGSAALRASVAEALARADLARRVLPGAERSGGLLPPGLWPAPSPPREPAPAPTPRQSTPVALVVSAEVPPVLSQRVMAYLGQIGLDATVTAVAPDRVLATTADARLLLWAPEVPEPELALRELAALGPPVAGVADGLASAARERDPQRRYALLQDAERALRGAAVLVPVAVVPVAAHAQPRLRGLAADRAGRLLLEDAWLEP